MYLKVKNSLQALFISSFKYVFIVFYIKKSEITLKYFKVLGDLQGTTNSATLEEHFR